MSRRKTTFIIVALIVLLGGSWGLSQLFISMKPEGKKKPDVNLKRFVKAEKVEYQRLVSPLTAQGRVVSSSEVTLVAEAAGKLETGSVALRKGTTFKKGQLLAIVYKDEVELALKASKSRFLSTITSILPDIKIDYPNYCARFSDFFNAIDIDKELPGVPEVDNEKLKVYLASKNFLSEYYGILQDEKKLNRHSLHAPFNGSFTQVNFEIGGYVNTGGQIAKMIRTDQLEVEVPVKNEESKWIRIGDTVQVYTSNKADANTGVVVRKSNFIDANTQSRSIFVKVPNAHKEDMLVGEYKIVDFPGHAVDKAMEIPRNAIFNSNEVFVVIAGKLKKQQVNILKWNETTVIFDGLKEGAMVVSEPLINVKENTPVGIFGIDKPDTPQKGKKGMEKDNANNKESQKG